MKGSHWFILIIVVFLGLMFVVEYNLPKKFVWNPTFSEYDYQPFGCAVFDDVINESWDSAYYNSSWTFYQFAGDTVGEPLALMVIAQRLKLSDTDRRGLLEFVERGNKVILVAEAFSLSDTLNYDLSYGWFSMKRLKAYATDAGTSRDSICWQDDSSSGSYPPRSFYFYPPLCNVHFTRYDSLFVPIASVHIDSSEVRRDSLPDEYAPVAVRRKIGKGELILATTPLIFTNYGILDKDNAAYVFRILSVARGLPLYRTRAYNGEAETQESPLRYFLSQPALRLGVYLTLITIVLFMIFTARRRQRPIPVFRWPDNKTLEFTGLIGTLYFQRKNHGDLVRKKFTFFAEALRRQIQVDAEDDSNDVALCRKIACKTGLDEAEIVHLFALLRPVVRGDREAGEDEMKEWIDKMNKILNKL